MSYISRELHFSEKAFSENAMNAADFYVILYTFSLLFTIVNTWDIAEG